MGKLGGFFELRVGDDRVAHLLGHHVVEVAEVVPVLLCVVPVLLLGRGIMGVIIDCMDLLLLLLFLFLFLL